MTLYVTVLLLMQSLVPENQHYYYEPAETTEMRYEAIAATIAHVAETDDPVPELGVERTAFLLATIAARESFFIDAVVECRRHGLGHAWGAYQIQRPRFVVCADLEHQTRAALVMVRESFQVCQRQRLDRRLSFFTDGRCDGDVAHRRSSWRVLPAMRWAT